MFKKYSLKQWAFITTSIGLVWVGQSCKKYGYDFVDGTKKGNDATELSTDSSLNANDFSLYSHAAIYPGLVDDTVTRLENYPVILDLNFIKNPEQLRISNLPRPWLSTSMYAPTGEPITVDVPDGVYGLVAQIGCWTDNLSTILAKGGPQALKRDVLIYTTKPLFPGRNYIRSPYGGPIYIIPSFAQDKRITIQFSGACKMADFEMFKTDPVAWRNELLHSGVPWMEMRSKRMIFSMPTDVVRYKMFNAPFKVFGDPNATMKFWDDLIRIDFDEWEGLSENPADPIDQSPGMPWRFVYDIQPSIGLAHSGFPVVGLADNGGWMDRMDPDYMRMAGSWGIIHEIGHNNQQSNWTWGNMGETTNNLFNYKFLKRMNIIGELNDDGYRRMFAWVARTDTATKDMINDAEPTELKSPKCLFYLQLFEKYGWDLMTKLYTRTRRAAHTSNNDQDKIDFVYLNACEQAQLDLYVFFRFWGLRPSLQARNEVAAQGWPKLKKKLWMFNPATHKGGEDPI